MYLVNPGICIWKTNPFSERIYYNCAPNTLA